DINEEPYQIDSKLQQLRYSGKLDQLKGIVLGDFAKSEPKTDRPAFTLQEIFTHYLSDLGIPVMSGFQIGHCQPHFAIPFGVSATLSTAQKQLSIEPAVQRSEERRVGKESRTGRGRDTGKHNSEHTD